jgi:hypothetical protein
MLFDTTDACHSLLLRLTEEGNTLDGGWFKNGGRRLWLNVKPQGQSEVPDRQQDDVRVPAIIQEVIRGPQDAGGNQYREKYPHAEKPG